MVLRPHEKSDHDSLSLETLVSSIALSEIIGSQATGSLRASFEEVDVAVLKWIAGEARRMSQRRVNSQKQLSGCGPKQSKLRRASAPRSA